MLSYLKEVKTIACISFTTNINVVSKNINVKEKIQDLRCLFSIIINGSST